MITQSELSTLLSPLDVEWPRSAFDAARLGLWHKHLEQCRPDEIEFAVAQVILNSKYFPKISEVLAIIGASRQSATAGESEQQYQTDMQWIDSIQACERLLEAKLWEAGVQVEWGVQQSTYTVPTESSGRNPGQPARYVFNVQKVAEQACAATLRWRESNPSAKAKQVLSRGYGQIEHMART